MNKQLAYPHTVDDILAEYKQKKEMLPSAIKAFKSEINVMENSVNVWSGNTLGGLLGYISVDEKKAYRILRNSTWNSIYSTLSLDSVMSASDKKRYESSMIDPPEPTIENLQATFGPYWSNPRYYILKSLAEVFNTLDPFYRSHSNFGVGVKGLPKRIILSNFRTTFGGGPERLSDVCRAMLQVKPDAWLGEYVEPNERQSYSEIIRKGVSVWKVIEPFTIEQLGLTVKQFQNGNAHVYFNEKALNLVNEALHEFYGTVIPDDAPPPDKQKASSAVSKDLAFYRTPPAVIDRIVNELRQYVKEGTTVLEPSCGDGAIMDALRQSGFKPIGVEVYRQRAEICKAKGHVVSVTNFLEFESFTDYEAIVMNPPFASRHYRKHLDKALSLLDKEKGVLIAVLPATAKYKHGLPAGGTWYDLPVASFAESGTNVNTGYWIYRNRPW